MATDGREVQISPTVIPDAGGFPGGASSDATPSGEPGSRDPNNPPPCKDLALFKQVAVPLLKKHCVECHDGTKGTATIAFALSFINQPDLSLQCSVVLLQGYKEPQKPRQEAGLFMQSDPAHPEVEHEFKFEKDPGAYGPYRDGMMMWLAAE